MTALIQLERPAATGRAQGFELWRGPARFTRDEIVVVATGYDRQSSNEKTGPMIQTYILVAGESPTDAIKSGADAAICGSCSFRPALAKGTDSPACYVNKGHGPLAVWRAWTLGRYPVLDPTAAGELAAAKGRPIRIGTYGDPGMVPVAVWRSLLGGRRHRHTGYTHQWRNAPFLRSVCMASCDSLEDRADAVAAGWRTFRVGSEIIPGEISCPASIESGKLTTCAKCRLCDGSRGADDRRKSVAIRPHGGAIALELARAGRDS